MATKLTELRDGCFAKAMDDEPMFVLLARDPQAPALVRQWATRRRLDIGMGRRPSSDMAQVDEAERNADNMESWRLANDGAWRTGLFGGTASTVERPEIVGTPYRGGTVTTTLPVMPEAVLPRRHALLADIRCKAVQYHDYKVCRECDLTWPVDGARPDGCRGASIQQHVDAITAALDNPPEPIDNPDFEAVPHNVERQGDEYFCQCGFRWATDEDDPHE